MKKNNQWTAFLISSLANSTFKCNRKSKLFSIDGIYSPVFYTNDSVELRLYTDDEILFLIYRINCMYF